MCDKPVVGRHLVVELGGCDPSLLDDPEVIRELIRRGAEAAGTRLLGEMVHHFQPVGVTGIGLLAESHLAVHTWPERGYAAVDLLTCNVDADFAVLQTGVVDCLRRALLATSCEVRVLERRLP